MFNLQRESKSFVYVDWNTDADERHDLGKNIYIHI